MLWKNSLKYPVLAIGILFTVIYLTDPKTAKFWEGSSRFIPNTCKALLDRTEAKTPDNWEFKCPGTSRIMIYVDLAKNFTSDQAKRQSMYREIVNSLTQLGQYSNPETLEQVKVVELFIQHEGFTVGGLTDGQAVVRLFEIARNKKSTQKDLLEHIKLTVKTKEFKD